MIFPYILSVFMQKKRSRHRRLSGRIESYVKYAELAYDLFHSGFDVLIIDHRGGGVPGVCFRIRIAVMSITLMIMSTI